MQILHAQQVEAQDNISIKTSILSLLISFPVTHKSHIIKRPLSPVSVFQIVSIYQSSTDADDDTDYSYQPKSPPSPASPPLNKQHLSTYYYRDVQPSRPLHVEGYRSSPSLLALHSLPRPQSKAPRNHRSSLDSPPKCYSHY